jgi:hypothetical protein
VAWGKFKKREGCIRSHKERVGGNWRPDPKRREGGWLPSSPFSFKWSSHTHTHSLSWAGCFVVLEKTNKSLSKPYRLIDCTFSSSDHLQSKLEKFGLKKGWKSA